MGDSDATAAAGRKARLDAGEKAGSSTKKRRLNLGLVPEKGDPRRPPLWLPSALLMVAIAVFLGIWAWGALGSLKTVIVDLIICFFLAMAIEPPVLFLIRHGWRRGVAALVVWLAVLIVVGILIWLFGQMFVQQVIGLVGQIPSMYNGIAKWVASRTPWKLPRITDLGQAIGSSFNTDWVSNIAGTAVSTISSVTSGVMSLMIVLFVTYYISASGPRFRQAVCSLLKPSSQRTFLVVWDVISNQISSFLSSRVVLASISAVFMSIFMVILGVPYWLPMALMYAVISQFVPMVGGIIGAILPVIVTLSHKSVLWAVIMVAYVTVYQQIENMLIAPRVQQRTMDVNPAVGLIAVFAFGDVFGFLGSFLALPVVASIQVIITAYTMRQELVDSPMLDDPKPKKRSKVVVVSEELGKKLHLGRRVVGSTRRARDDSREQLRESWERFDRTSSIPIHSLSTGESMGEAADGENEPAAEDAANPWDDRDSAGTEASRFHTAEEMDSTETVAIVKKPSLRRAWKRDDDSPSKPAKEE